MKNLFTIMCSMFMFLCVFAGTTKAEEFEWAQKARGKGPSPATKAAYEKAVADQKAKQELQRQKHLEEQEQFRKFEAEQAAIEEQYEADQQALQKECGGDYGQIRVGMTLTRVQKCVAEFFLRGQIKTKNGVVDHYTRGNSWMYVKKGKVVAWGD